MNMIIEWTQLSRQLPAYSGAVYTRWGRKSCGAQSKLIYRGQMTGPDHKSTGGGANFQCLPNDPEYDPQAITNVPHSKLRSVIYSYNGQNLFSTDIVQHQVPCTVCEADQRMTKLMIPAMNRCPSSEWVLEYKGYLMSSAEHQTDGRYVDNSYDKMSYVCVDAKPESVKSKPSGSWSGHILYAVTVSCSGDGALGNCPPYLSDGRALSCVVCSK